MNFYFREYQKIIIFSFILPAILFSVYVQLLSS